MRKQHHKLNRIMEGILKCDRIIKIDLSWTNGEGTPNFQYKYTRIRARLYRSYSEQLAKMAQQIVSYELQGA